MEPVALFVGGLAAGMVAGTASCTAVQGGLLTGLTTGATTASGPKVVSLFLAGRLASHLVAGALLGLLGSAVRLTPGARAVLMVAAGVAVTGFGLRLLVARPRACPSRGGGRHAAPALGRAALLGASTVLLPCGVTLSAEAVAVSSGSALGGTAVMAGFVIGSAPAFALLGLVLRRISSTRLAALAGVLALAAGIWTATSGLRLGGWLSGPAAAQAVQQAQQAQQASEARPGQARPPGAGGVQRIEIWATDRGYRPGIVTARAGVPVEIDFRLAGSPGCARSLTIDGRDVALPAVVRLGPQRPGSLRYVCSMGMYAGFVTFV
ncbi:sulfite exporter TauE/SafE family protein [Planobispora siamensis]|uniref:Urease accessory protein UreH-like transmembrane domain-containing protein n=1 Tax=Planobispora siamensis TaxID=936338 RepID=A0A8J3SC57_9ACTN|nr:sulfite exporter TauE/SafE family protein [Planobispora siamensis]GIH89860.1 hypothetical protein Psi01_04900 [Planobispora siamensis]